MLDVVRMRNLEGVVYPSDKRTIMSDGPDRYVITPCNTDGEYDYEHIQDITFVGKTDGIQDEQLALVLLDRAEFLKNFQTPANNKKMVAGLKQFLAACKSEAKRHEKSLKQAEKFVNRQ
jgi:hypothetical protein